MIDHLCDGHVHTKLCHHAFGEMENYVEAALSRGLQRMIFLEHFEIGISYFETTWLVADDFNYYKAEGERLRHKYRGQIEIGVGVEVGLNLDRISETNEFIHSYEWDRVGLSYHFMPVTGENHINMLSRKHENIERIAVYGHDLMLDAYYEGLLKGIGTIEADVVCHLDAGLRNSKDVVYKERHWQLIDRILELMVKRKMALEVNTSGYTLRGEAFPCQKMVDMARNRRIKLVLGSDAHKPEQVGRGFDLGGV